MTGPAPATRPRTGSRLPGWDVANRAYIRTKEPISFKQQIGGNVDDTHGGKEWLTDTCTLRMSHAFNYSGVLIPEHWPGLRTVHGKDKLNYAFAVAEFHKWIVARFGKPDIEVAGPPVSRSAFIGQHGLIIFGIKFANNFGMTWGATGHVDLWDGKTFYDEKWGISMPGKDFFQMAHHVSLWKMAGSDSVTL